MLVALLLIAQPHLHTWLPCTQGLSIEYAIESKKTGAKYTTIETVLGPGKEPRSCLIERKASDRSALAPVPFTRAATAGGVRKTGDQRDVLMREYLDDRISNAGYADQPVALRAPLLKAPVQKDRGWYFTSTHFTIADTGNTYDVPAGTFDDCARVHEVAKDGSHEADSVYAPGIGLISYESRDLRMRAIRIDNPDAKNLKRRTK